MSDDELAHLSLERVAALIESRRVSPLDLTRACLHRIETQNPALNAFITVTAEAAIEAAKNAEAEIVRGGWRGPLHGIPVALKDNIDTAGTRTTAASALFEDRIPAENAVVVDRLERAGAIVVGKLNMQEFAYGGTSVPSHFGPTLNPWNLSCIAGGSSGGSAAAVAARLCFAALGTDTGGSIREPAAFCGVVGFKPTHGRISTRGVIPLASSLDHVGPLARTAKDCRLVLDAVSGCDADDPTCDERPIDYEPMSLDLRGVRLGVPREFFYAALHPEVSAAIEAALELWVSFGAEVREIVLPVSTDRTVFRAEAYAEHAENIAERPERYIKETLAKLRLGADVDTRTYIAARTQLSESRRQMRALFSSIDALVTPTAPVPAPRLSDYPTTFEGVLKLEGSSILRNTRPFNSYGIPAISVPCGLTSDGLPIGLHIAGPAWREGYTLALAHAYQSATDWHERAPPLRA